MPKPRPSRRWRAGGIDHGLLAVRSYHAEAEFERGSWCAFLTDCNVLLNALRILVQKAAGQHLPARDVEYFKTISTGFYTWTIGDVPAAAPTRSRLGVTHGTRRPEIETPVPCGAACMGPGFYALAPE